MDTPNKRHNAIDEKWRAALGVDYEFIDSIPPGWILATEYCQKIGITSKAMHYKLQRLKEKGKAERKKIRFKNKGGPASFIWRLI